MQAPGTTERNPSLFESFPYGMRESLAPPEDWSASVREWVVSAVEVVAHNETLQELGRMGTAAFRELCVEHAGAGESEKDSAMLLEQAARSQP